MDLKQFLAVEAAMPEAEAADQVDRVVAGILRRLRDGNKVELPGVGILQKDGRQRVKLQPLPKKSKGDR